MAQGTGNTTNSSPRSGIFAGATNSVSALTNGFIGAGQANRVFGGSASAVVAGINNLVANNSANSFIGAGNGNVVVGGFNTVIVAGVRNTNFAGKSVIVGGQQNVIGSNSRSSTIAGGEFNVVEAINPSLGTLLYATIGGGQSNLVGSNGLAATIGGGIGNQALANFAGIAAGQGNIVADISTGSVIGGGVSNTIAAPTVIIDGITNPAVGTVAGGGGNSVFGTAGTIGGGAFNFNGGNVAVIAGGYGNQISGFDFVRDTSGDESFIGAGSFNVSSNYAGTIVGGYSNSVVGDYGVIAGGQENTAGSYAAVPGGYKNEATGDGSFAGGALAKATNSGAFVWSGYYEDTETVSTVSTNDGSFTVRTPGGARFITSTNANVTLPNSGVSLSPGANSWSSLSDSNSKTAIKPINARAFLHKLASLPISEWEYRGQSGRRFVGPMAQDFHTAFGLGSDDKTISTSDTDGVMYAAIKGLVEELGDRDKAIQKLESELEILRGQVQKILPPAP
jgi:hypothetical protein